MEDWEQREQKIAAVDAAIRKLECTEDERTELIEMLYQEDFGSRIDTETPEQIAAERLAWLRRQSDE